MALRNEAARNWFRENAARFSGQLFFDEPLSKYTYYRIGGPALILAIPQTIADLHWLTQAIQATQVPYFILGQGSNVLFPDHGYDGVIIRTSRLNLEITPDHLSTNLATNLANNPSNAPPPPSSDRLRIRTGASVAISSLLRKAAQEGWGGLEFLAGVPGSIGGVIRMNAGTNIDVSQSPDRLFRVAAYPLTEGSHSQSENSLEFYTKKDFLFEYRKNLFLPPDRIVWAVEWDITPEEPAVVKARIDEILGRRKANQPVEFPSCGSVFKNLKNTGQSAWQVIQQLGLKGHRIGNAQFSEKHCNFIINLGGAKAEDVRSLINLAKQRAEKELGIQLEEEVIQIP